MVEVILICMGVAVGIGLATRIDSEPKRPSAPVGTAAEPPGESAG